MLILGIETSCDETAASVVKDGREILSNVVASSVELHQKYGGIIPEIAAREQARCIIPVIEESIKGIRGIKSIKSLEGIDAIAVTVGPGLIGSLLVGVEAAKTLAFVLKKPIVPVNHLLAHFYAAWLQSNFPISQFPNFPLVGLVASGGHTELVLMKDHGKYTLLGGTRDDAAGECFDKCARILGLGYPGGPAIEAAALKVRGQRTSASSVEPSEVRGQLPRPMMNQRNFDFSFSGLKTAVLQEVKKKEVAKVSEVSKVSKVSKAIIRNFAGEVQEAITDVLVTKTIRAARKYKVKSIIVAGGVAANKRLREKFQSVINHQSLTINLFIPPPKLCTDNAVIIASCAFFNFKPIPWQKIQAHPSLSL